MAARDQWRRRHQRSRHDDYSCRRGGATAPGSRRFYRALGAGGGDLDLAPYDVAVDSSNRIYTIQLVTDSADPSYRVFRFPAYGGTTEAAADWKIGKGDD